MRPSPMRAEGDELAVGEAGPDLAGLDEMGVRAGDVAGLEDPQHRQAVFEVALLDAVDARLLQQAGGAVDPAAAAAEVAFEAEALGELRPEVRRPVHRAVGQQSWWARTQWAKPSSSWPVRYAAVASRSRSSTSRVSGSTSDSSRQASPHRQPSHAARASSMAHHAASLAAPAGGDQAKNASASSGRAPRNIHISAMRSPSNRYTNALRDSRVLPLRRQRGVFPLGGPAVGAEAELLVELDLAVGGLEQRTEHAEQPAELRDGRPPSGPGHGGGTRGRR